MDATRERQTNQGEKFAKTLAQDYSPFLHLEQNLAQKVNDQLFFLRQNVFWIIVGILIAEILFLFAMVILQAFKLGNFNLNEWTFGIFVNGCLLQTFFLIRCIVVHIFPSDPQKTPWLQE
jgi:hypothetical protein